MYAPCVSAVASLSSYMFIPKTIFFCVFFSMDWKWESRRSVRFQSEKLNRKEIILLVAQQKPQREAHRKLNETWSKCCVFLPESTNIHTAAQLTVQCKCVFFLLSVLSVFQLTFNSRLRLPCATLTENRDITTEKKLYVYRTTNKQNDIENT